MLSSVRVGYLDIAKGICIFLVVFGHLLGFYNIEFVYESKLKTFELPLFFFLSGVFFKQYSSFEFFLKKKINGLLIPFLLFYVLTSVLLPIFLLNEGIKMQNMKFFNIADSFVELFLYEDSPNGPVWFLLCTLELSFLFYFILNISKYSICPPICIFFISLCMGIMGLLLGYYHISIPFFIDTVFTSIPFFSVGYILNKYSSFFTTKKFEKFYWALIILLSLFIIHFGRYVNYRTNTFNGLSVLTAYPTAICGILLIVLLSKKIVRCPILELWGRNTLLILCTHRLLYQLFDALLFFFVSNVMIRFALNLTIVMLMYFLLIPFFNRYMSIFVGKYNTLTL